MRLQSELTAAWAGFLSAMQWHTFATLTFASSSPAECVERRVRAWIVRVWYEAVSVVEPGNCYRRLVGEGESTWAGKWPRGYRRGQLGPYYVIGIEPHLSGRLHAHAVVRWPLNNVVDHDEAWLAWTHGVRRVEPCRGCDAASQYVTKYVVKAGAELVLRLPRSYASSPIVSASVA